MILVAPPTFAQTANINVYETFEGGTNGQALTTSALNAGLVCNGAGGVWTLPGNASTQMQLATAAEAPLPTPITACGKVFTPPDGIVGVTYNLNTSSTGYAKFSWTGTSNNASLGIWFKTDLPTTDTNYHSMLAISDGTGDFVGLMIRNGFFYLEAGVNPNGNPNVGSFFPYTANKWYWVSEQFQAYVNSSSMHSLAIYDCGTPQAPVLPCTQLSLQRKFTASFGTVKPNYIVVGKDGDTGTPNNLVYYDNLLADTTGQTFPILPTSGPILTSLSQTVGAVGTSITITGTNFGTPQGTSTVTFNGISTTPTSWSATSIVAPVPAAATTGNVVVTVNGFTSNGINFTVTSAPTIIALSPASGPVGTPVTISGGNFGALQGSSSVTFGGIATSPISWSDTSIVVPVPSGAAAGNVVVNAGGVASNGVNFNVTSGNIALVQHTSRDAGSTTSSSLAFVNPSMAGDLIAVLIRAGTSSSQTFTVKDSNGNTYKQAAQVGFPSGTVSLAIFYAENIKAGANTITVSDTASGPLRFAISEYSGVATSSSIDGTSTAAASSSSPNSGNATTTANGDLLLGAVGTTNAATFTAATGYTIRDFVPAEPSTKLICEDQIQAAAGLASASASLAASDSWGAVLAAFKPAGGVAGIAARITPTSGTPQSAAVNAAFATQLQATVKDSFNNPVSGVTVTFAAPASGASGTFAGGLATATTNAQGVATAAVFTANTVSGAYTVTASVAGVSTPANFSLTNLAGAAASISATAGTPQNATINTVFATQLQATVKDSFNNPVSGVTVTFAAPASGASGTFSSGVNTATTNVQGVATAPVFTANTVVGTYTVTASVTGVATSANFSLTNLAGAPSSITASAGTPQSATISTAFATQLQATVKDSGGNPVNGVLVTFAAPASGASGTFGGGVATATTNGQGVATAAVFTANTIAGAYTVTASVAGVSTPANFSLTNLAGAAASIAATAGTPQSSSINTALATQLQATVKDSGGNPVNGVLVTFTTPASGASGAFAGGLNTATTNAQGVATAAVFTANGTAGGPYNVAASVSGVATPANFSLTNLGNPPANITTSAGTPQSATISTAFATPLQVTVQDSFNNPVSGVTVTFTAPASGASGTFAGGVNTATTNAQGVATAVVFTANSTAGGPYNVAASVSGIATPANFSLTNLAGAAATVTATAGTPQNANINTAFTAQLQATVKDSGGNPVNGVLVTFTAPTSGASGTFAGGVNTATTNAQGVATAAVFTANSTAGGPYNVAASVSGVAAPANFSLTNLAGAPSTITASAGTPQSATISTAFATQLQTTVKDSFNNPVNGVTVTFTAPASGASGTFGSGVSTATTNAQGVATAAVFTANSTAGGPYSVAASVSGVTTPANFSLTNLAGAASSITTSAGTPQSATINTAFATQLQATLKDSGGNPVNGVLVTFAAPANGASGTFAGGVNTATTNAQGVATAPIFTANSTAGGYSVTASATGVATSANFSLTNLAGAPASIIATAGTRQSAVINTAFATPLQATIKDAANNPASGVTVTFTAPASGASGAFAGGLNTTTTNAQGVATAAVFTANGTAGGPYNITASVSGVATAANFSLTNLGNPPANVTATAGTPQSAAIGTAFATPLQVTVTDSGSSPVSSVTVTFAAPASGASGTFAGGVNTATTNAQGVATAPTFTANSVAGGPYTVTASVSGVATPASFLLTNLAGAAATVTGTAGTPQSVTINTAFATQLQVTVKDSGGNPVNGVLVTFTTPASGASGAFAGGVNTATTNAQGVATAPIFTADSTAGGYSVTASAPGVATPANFSLTNLAGAAASATASAGTPQSTNINTAFATQLQVTVKDSGGNPVNGVLVTFTAPASGPSGTFAGGVNTATTNTQGVATAAVFTANGTAGGPYNVAASVSGVATAASFSLTNTASAPANIALVQHTSKDGGTTTSTSLVFGKPNTAGNWIGVVIRAGNSSSQVFKVTDSNGNAYRKAIQFGQTVASNTLGIFYAENVKSGVNTVTVSDTISGILRVAILEYSGVAGANSLDGIAAAQGSSNSPNSGTVTTTVNGDLLLGAVLTYNPGTFTGGAGYTIEERVPAEPNTKLIAEDQIQLTAGITSASASLSAVDNWAAGLAAFKVATSITGLSPASGPVGTSVTITGKNFGVPQGTSTVTFNGTTASPASWSATSIVAPVPAGATAGNVVVTVGGVASNGVNFTVTLPPPSITNLSPSSAVVGGGPLVLTVTGANFVSSSVVQWNGTARATTFISSTQLQATVTAADIATAGVARVAVSNAAVGGGASGASAFLVGTTGGSNFAAIVVSQAAQDIVYDPKNQVFYLSVARTASTNPNTISVLDPATASITSAQPAGNNPNVLAISGDSQFLYAGIDGTSTVQRFILPGLAQDISYPLGSGSLGPFFALDLQVAPGAPHTTAVTLGNSGVTTPAEGGIVIFDDATARPTKAPGIPPLFGSIQWGSDATALFAANNESTGFDFYELSVTSSGVSLTSDFPNAFSSFGNSIHFDPGTKLIYSEEGHAIKPSTGLPVGNFNARGAMAVDSSLKTAFFVSAGSGATATIESFDLTHFTPIGTITIPNIASTPLHLIRWGQNGLAFISGGQVVLVGGDFVSQAPPFVLTPPPTPLPPTVPAPNAPAITSLNPSSAVAGSAGFVLNVTGTQFDPAATVQFNGSALTTTFVSSTQLQAAIPASDIAAPGTATIVVANPSVSGGNSSGATFFVGSAGGTSSAGTGFAVQIVNQASKEIVFDSLHQLFYLSVPNSQVTGNTIAVLDPATAKIVGQQYAGSNPKAIAISGDGQFLYAGLEGSSSVQRFILPGLAPDITYSLGAASFGSGPFYALDLQVAPGLPHTTAVTLAVSGSSPSALGGITIFDDALARPTVAKGFGPGGGGSALYDSLQWGADATALFAANNESTGFDFYSLSVTSTGVSLASDFPNTFSSLSNKIHFDTGTKLVYADDGHVVNPATGLSVGNFTVLGPMVPDSMLNLAFFAAAGTGSTITIQSFDLTHFTTVGSITISGVAGNPLGLIRWGQNGLAFNTDAGQIVLVGGNFVH